MLQENLYSRLDNLRIKMYNTLYRGMAQVVARLTGGQEVASSSLVTPTSGESPHTVRLRQVCRRWISLLSRNCTSSFPYSKHSELDKPLSGLFFCFCRHYVVKVVDHYCSVMHLFFLFFIKICTSKSV